MHTSPPFGRLLLGWVGPALHRVSIQALLFMASTPSKCLSALSVLSGSGLKCLDQQFWGEGSWGGGRWGGRGGGSWERCLKF